jgi:folate-binding protein YgfZ
MTADQFKAIEREGGCVDLSSRAKFRLTGSDNVRYLNGQVTNDVRKARDDSAMQACVTNVKGRIEAEVFIHHSSLGGILWLDAEPGLREALGARLERYIVADDVVLKDATEDWSLLHCFAGSEQEAESWGKIESISGMSFTCSCMRFGVPGFDVWFPLISPLPPAPRPLLSSDEAETLRILRGIPRWPNELNAEAFPQEAVLEASAMDFAKGCYIGQEVLSRIKTTGKMPRRLVRFTVQGSGFNVESGMKLMAGEGAESAKEAGVVTSVARHPLLDRQVGLAYVRQAFESADSLLIGGEDPPRLLGQVEITAL